ncbi:hypothetical protein GGI15_002207 [Coemansia interrupta]|uniref:3-oxo-5-alpha-steroid 4-dehydrogenase C-terminal domain-containing protein n=1 Tax=Coemansia interrupta TaxID=1126814 RepID=A0A9W8HF01_9FUNG|nr:hypothetical protein GGI15_002207 [Coemansia interrupta]
MSPIIAGALFVVGSPYGSQTGYAGRLAINGRAAWIVMELVSPATFLLSYTRPSSIGSTRSHITDLFALLWTIHYANRALIYPLRQPSRKPMHIGIMLSACLFNVVNGYINGRWLSTLYGRDGVDGPLCVLGGICMFAAGMFGNIYHDNLLMGLRRRATNGYSVPTGGLFSMVSCPHFLCELVEWTGYAVATGSPAAWAFVSNVACNLIPRAVFIHRWYRQTFSDYPTDRKAMVPFLI